MRTLLRILLGLLIGGILWVLLLGVNEVILSAFQRNIATVPMAYWFFLCLISFAAGILIGFSLLQTDAKGKDSSVTRLVEGEEEAGS